MLDKKPKDERELFHAYLRQNGLKKTYQKDLILNTFVNSEGHLSVEDVYALVKKKDKKVGIVTVFRTLKSLAACGIAREITLGDGLTRFEHSYHHPHHHHIVCNSCHRVIEFLCPDLEQLQSEIVERYGFQSAHHRFQIYGLCEDCRQQHSVGDLRKFDTEKVFVRDAVKMALCMEKRGIEFYRAAGARNQDQRGRAILEMIAEEETKHLQALESELQEIYRQEAGIDGAPMFLHFDPCTLEQMVPDLGEYETDGELRLDARHSLELAMALETRVAAFFKSYADKFTETEGKKVLQRFAEEEMRHFNRINCRLDETRVQA